MNRYCLKILKHLTKSGNDKSTDYISTLFCPAIVQMCLEKLEEEKYIEHTDYLYPVNADISPVEVDNWFITLKGLDFLTDHKIEWLKFWIPIGITNGFSLIALILSIISLLA